MRRIITTLLTIVTFTLTPTMARCDDSIIDETFNQNGYTWGMSDKEQIKQMKGMVVWGFFMAIATMLLAGFIPNSTSSTTTTGKAADQGSSLF